MPLVLGVDSSTQATTVEVRDADTGTLVASGRAAHPATTPPRSEHDPGVWWSAFLDALARTGRRDIAAVAVAGQQHGLVVTDEAGSVLRPAKLWNDTESVAEATAMVAQFGAEAWAKAVGLVPGAAVTITKLAWLARHEPGVYRRVGRVMLPHDWLTFRLTGRVVTDRGDASGTGYWSPTQDRWRPDVLRRIDDSRSESEWLARLPTVLGPAERADWLAAPVHEKVGLRGRPIVAAGTGDNMAAALGIGLAPRQTAVSIDAGGTVCTVSDEPVADPTGAVNGFADASGRFLPLVRTDHATRVTDLVAGLVSVGEDALGDLALSAPPGARGLVLVPRLDGGHLPHRPHATGRIDGLRGDTTREELARAAHEGVVCSLLDGLDALFDAGVRLSDTPIQLLGAGVRSSAYRRVLADLSGRPVVAPPGGEHVAKGACVQAAAALDEVAPREVAAAWKLGAGPVTDPDPAVDAEEIRARYAEVRDR